MQPFVCKRMGNHAAMNENNIISMDTPENPLQELLKKGAQQLLAQAIEAELAILLEKYENETINGLKRVVRNCYQPEHELGDIEELIPWLYLRGISASECHQSPITECKAPLCLISGT
ncbi:hypothetical protein ACU5EH_17450 [Aliivibrio salmonicida]|uniref:hypothetical protein n=1 Tax=Aliivibrio salmonicida TaxID=40269 RepID=UPI00406D2D6D